MKTNVEILGRLLGESLGHMVKLAEQGDEPGALTEMAEAKRLLNQVRLAGGLEEVPPSQMAGVVTAWKKTIADCVRRAKRTV